jgi:hypothetical protein
MMVRLHPATGVLWRTKVLVWRVLPKPLVRLASQTLRFWCALRLEVRSCRGRIRSLLAKKHWGVDLGPLGKPLPDEQMILDERTEAHSLGMQALTAAHPWASTIDLQIYLEGFRAGEQFARRISDVGSDKQVHADVAEPLSLASPRGGNSMPPHVTQQPRGPVQEKRSVVQPRSEPMRMFTKGDRVYVVKPDYLAGDHVPIESVVFDRVEDGLAYITDSNGLHWEIPMSVVCGVPEGHVFAVDLGTTSKPNPCLECGCEIIVPYRGPANGG